MGRLNLYIKFHFYFKSYGREDGSYLGGPSHLWSRRNHNLWVQMRTTFPRKIRNLLGVLVHRRNNDWNDGQSEPSCVIGGGATLIGTTSMCCVSGGRGGDTDHELGGIDLLRPWLLRSPMILKAHTGGVSLWHDNQQKIDLER